MRAIVLVAILAGGCATTEVQAPQAAEEPIAMTRKSWGKPVAEWRIAPSGEGWFKSTRQAGGFFDYDILTRRFSAGPDAYARLGALLGPAEGYVGRDLPCETRVTDAPYGTVTWGEGEAARQLRYDSGCMGAEAGGVMSALKAAEDFAEGLAAGAPIESVEEVRQPSN